MERVLEVPTAEAIAVRYELAGIGSRFLALTLDVAIQVAVAVAVLVAFAFLAPELSTTLRTIRLDKVFTIVSLSLLYLGAFALFFGYFIAFELLGNGQTPGKRALGIRVVRDAGFPVDVGASVVRNIVRIVETILGFYVISALVMVLSPENKRPGDMAAGTIVVRDRAEDAVTLDTLVAETGTHDENDGLDPSDYALMKQFLARRNTLEPQAAAEIAARIAARVRPKLRASFDFLDDVALFEHVTRSRPPNRV